MLTPFLSCAQFDRLHFAYHKTISDTAYNRTMEKLLERERQANAAIKAAQ